ncbi:RIP metalloprotease RseP [Candidatus Igneacidithiobacillus taiwanensis]|uniref:RIP metalloprotease RseP n=1 Tax=Candidatus Igneacidithiobacillus taiwanensis TaxID=1945924 RepID=UPI0028A2D018|nr:RIP metalloprotease RseP [Candidatus Igneacidithiobacillus taiwanensis]
MNILITLLAFIIAVSILVTFHEAGHFFVARALGVRILRFSVGFGPALWQRRFGADAIEFRLAAIPFGGYVKMLEATPGETVPDGDRGRAYNTLPPARRMLIAIAGPGANFVLAIFLYAAVGMLGIPGIAPIIGHVDPHHFAAQHSTLQAGDRIESVNGVAVHDWESLRQQLLAAAMNEQAAKLTLRNAQGQAEETVLPLQRLPKDSVGPGFLGEVLGLGPYLPPVIGRVLPHTPAATLGLQPGDRILTIGGQPIYSWQDVVHAIEKQGVKQTSLRWQTPQGRLQEGQVQLQMILSQGKPEGYLGVTLAPLPKSLIVVHRRGLLPAIGYGAQQSWSVASLSVEMIWRMLQGSVSTRNISGPVGIAEVAGQSFVAGVTPYLSFLALLSISLGVINLFPLPVLDGGHVLFALAEILRGRPLPPEWMQKAQMIGIVLILMLLFLALYNDTVRMLKP